MKICTYAASGDTPRLGVMVDDRVVDVVEALAAEGVVDADSQDPMKGLVSSAAAISALRTLLRRGLDAQRSYAAVKVSFLPPITQPGKILCIAANYKAHILETGTISYVEKRVATPWFFLKPNTTMVGHGGVISLPSMSQRVDWEAELGVVIGRRAKDVPVDDALTHVFGYTIVNDVSAREIEVGVERELRDRDRFHDWLHGKWFDTFLPIGPCIVTTDEIADPQDLRIELRVNGEVMQDTSTSEMIFSVAEQIAFASRICTLEPGDVICTGTPSGVGKARGRFLKPQDHIRVSIDGVGVLENSVAG